MKSSKSMKSKSKKPKSSGRKSKKWFEWQKQKNVLTFDGYLSFLNEKRASLLDSFEPTESKEPEYSQVEVDEWIVLVQERDSALRDLHTELNQKLLRNCIASIFSHMKEFMDLYPSNTEWISRKTVDSLKLLARNLKQDYDASFHQNTIATDTTGNRKVTSSSTRIVEQDGGSLAENLVEKSEIKGGQPNGHLANCNTPNNTPQGNNKGQGDTEISGGPDFDIITDNSNVKPDLEHALPGCVSREEMQEALENQERNLKKVAQDLIPQPPPTKEDMGKGQRSNIDLQRSNIDLQRSNMDLQRSNIDFPHPHDEEVQDLIALGSPPPGDRGSPVFAPPDRRFPSVLKASATSRISGPLQDLHNVGLSSILLGGGNGHSNNRTPSLGVSDDEYVSVRSGTRSQNSGILSGFPPHATTNQMYLNPAGLAWLRAEQQRGVGEVVARVSEEDQRSEGGQSSGSVD